MSGFGGCGWGFHARPREKINIIYLFYDVISIFIKK
jgi:hypothetical protein